MKGGPYPFDPDWCIRPGKTLREWMTDKNLSVRAVSLVCGRMPPETVEGILDGSVKITPDLAGGLAGTGIPASLWLNLERIYRAGLATGKIDAS